MWLKDRVHEAGWKGEQGPACKEPAAQCQRVWSDRATYPAPGPMPVSVQKKLPERHPPINKSHVFTIETLENTNSTKKIKWPWIPQLCRKSLWTSWSFSRHRSGVIYHLLALFLEQQTVVGFWDACLHSPLAPVTKSSCQMSVNPHRKIWDDWYTGLVYAP